MVRPALVNIAHAAAVGIAFFALASVSIAWTRFGGGAALLWPATSVLLAFFAVRPPREWPLPAIAAGFASLLASTWFGLGLEPGIPIAVAVVLEALLPALILRRVRGDPLAFDSLPSLGLFVLLAGALAPALSGLIGGAAITLRTGIGFGTNWMGWYAAHGLGTITFAPLLILLLRGDVRRWNGAASWGRRIEAAVLLAIVAIVNGAVFLTDTTPLLFLPFLPLLIATFRLGRLGATASVILLAVIGGVLTFFGHGPISLLHGSIGDRAQFLQFYLAVAVTMVMPVAAELKRRQRLFLRLQQSEASFRLMAENLGDMLIHTDTKGEIRFASPAALELSGQASAQLLGRDSADFVYPEDLDGFEDVRRSALANPDKSFTLEYRAITTHRGIEWRETRMRSYVDEQGKPAGMILVVRDISRRKAAEVELASKAATDALTGLPNRRLFFARLDYLQSEIAAGRANGCVTVLDLDHFKAINDRHGHATGDAVLRAVAEAARGALRGSDLLARLGGEEFGILLWGASLAEASRTCDRVRAAIAAVSVRSANGLDVHVTSSLGVAPLLSAGTPAEAYEQADRALYAAKAAGRNRVREAA